MILQTFRKFNTRTFQNMKEFYMPNRVSLGRWNIEKCEKKMFTKTDYSNEDHCGTCSVNFDSQAMIIQLPLIKTKENANMIDSNDDECYKYYLL